MVSTPDFVKMNKALRKRISKRESKLLPKIKKLETDEPEELPPIHVTEEQFTKTQEQIKKLEKRRDELNEAWRLAVEEGDDRETDALSVALKLLEENTLELSKQQEILSRAKKIRRSGDEDLVEIGSDVLVEILGEAKKKRFRLVDPVEADPQRSKFSFESPIGSALIGKRTGMIATYKGPNGETIKLKVLSIR